MDRKQIAREVFEKTGVRITDSDPVIALMIANNIYFEQTMMRFEKTMKVMSDQNLAAMAKAPEAAEQVAIKMLNRAGNWADGRIGDAGKEAAALVNEASEKAVAAIQQAVHGEIQKIQKLGSYFRAVVWVLGIAFGIAASLWIGQKIGYMLPMPGHR